MAIFPSSPASKPKRPPFLGRTFRLISNDLVWLVLQKRVNRWFGVEGLGLHLEFCGQKIDTLSRDLRVRNSVFMLYPLKMTEAGKSNCDKPVEGAIVITTGWRFLNSCNRFSVLDIVTHPDIVT